MIVLSEYSDEVRGAIRIIERYITEMENDVSLSEYVENVDNADVYSYFSERPEKAINLVGELEEYFDSSTAPSMEDIKSSQGPFPDTAEPSWQVEEADATKIIPKDIGDIEGHTINLSQNSVDLIVTSPPYWRKRDYDHEDQLGQERSPDEYIENLVQSLEHWKKFLRPTGSVFLNIGDTYQEKNLAGIPDRFSLAVSQNGWTIRNKIIWAKDNGVPSSAQDRLVPRYEPIYHLVLDKNEYFYDLHGYAELYGNGSNPGDVWRISHDQNTGGHLAPFPRDLVRRAITLACPPSVCTTCGKPRRRIRERGLTNLNMDRPQARRALEIFEESDKLSLDHIRAIQARGISDAGKAQEFQSGSDQNDEQVVEYAQQAKDILGGYFREFTFPQWSTAGWTTCECNEPDWDRGCIFDPFAGSGTTIQVAVSMGYHGYGTDLDVSKIDQNETLTAYT